MLSTMQPKRRKRTRAEQRLRRAKNQATKTAMPPLSAFASRGDNEQNMTPDGLLAMAEAVTGKAQELFGPEPESGYAPDQVDAAATALGPEMQGLWVMAKKAQAANA